MLISIIFSVFDSEIIRMDPPKLLVFGERSLTLEYLDGTEQFIKVDSKIWIGWLDFTDEIRKSPRLQSDCDVKIIEFLDRLFEYRFV